MASNRKTKKQNKMFGKEINKYLHNGRGFLELTEEEKTEFINNINESMINDERLQEIMKELSDK